MKHILRSLPLGKPFCPHCLASHSSKHSLHALFTTHQIHIHGHRVAPWCVAPVRPPDASQPAAWPTITRRPPPPPCPGPSLAPSVPPLFSHIHHARDRGSEGRAGGEEDYSWRGRGRRRHPLHHHMRSLGEARLGRVGGINAKTRKPTPSLPPWFHLPLASSLPLLLFISFISTEQCMRGTCYGNGWHACAWTHNTARSGCCSSGLPRENESGFW